MPIPTQIFLFSPLVSLEGITSPRSNRVKILFTKMRSEGDLIGGCDRAIPSPNRLTERFAYKIKRLLKNIALLYSPGSHANELDAGP